MKKSLRDDPDWQAFAEVCKPDFARCDFQAQLIAACGGEEDIAWAIYFHHRAAALEWLEGEVPFLGRSRPCDLIKRGRGDRVRECLWRTP